MVPGIAGELALPTVDCGRYIRHDTSTGEQAGIWGMSLHKRDSTFLLPFKSTLRKLEELMTAPARLETRQPEREMMLPSKLEELALATSEQFDRPVVILTGLGHPTAISSSMEAFMFLAEWPVSKRDACHRFTMETCLASVRTDVDAGLARALFVSWCDQNAILAPSPVGLQGCRSTNMGAVFDDRSLLSAA